MVGFGASRIPFWKKIGWLSALVVGLLFIILSFSQPVWAATYYVRTDGSDTNCDGTVDAADTGVAGSNCAEATINEGISDASSGDTVQVAAGTYTGDVDVSVTKTNLDLAGVQADVSTASRSNLANESVIEGKVSVSGANTELNGFYVTNQGGGDGVIVDSASGVNLHHNIIDAIGSDSSVYTGAAVGVRVTATAPVADLSITNNQVSNIGNDQGGDSYGVFLGDGAGAGTIDAEISQNGVAQIAAKPDAKKAFGISVSQSAPSLKVTDNKIGSISGQSAYGINFSADAVSATITGNHIHDLNSDNLPAQARLVNFGSNLSASTTTFSNNILALINLGTSPAEYLYVANALGNTTLNASHNYWGTNAGPGNDNQSGSLTINDWCGGNNYAALLNTDGDFSTLCDPPYLTPANGQVNIGATALDLYTLTINDVAMVPNANKVLLSSSDNTTTATIAAATTVTGEGMNGLNDWQLDGSLIEPPTILANSSISITPPAGTSTIVSKVVQFGSGIFNFLFNKSARIWLSNQHDRYVGYQQNGGAFTSIDRNCSADSQAAADALLLPSGECKINAGSDLVVWTTHSTKFATYLFTSTGAPPPSPPPNPPSSSNPPPSNNSPPSSGSPSSPSGGQTTTSPSSPSTSPATNQTARRFLATAQKRLSSGAVPSDSVVLGEAQGAPVTSSTNTNELQPSTPVPEQVIEASATKKHRNWWWLLLLLLLIILITYYAYRQLKKQEKQQE